MAGSRQGPHRSSQTYPHKAIHKIAPARPVTMAPGASARPLPAARMEQQQHHRHHHSHLHQRSTPPNRSTIAARGQTITPLDDLVHALDQDDQRRARPAPRWTCMAANTDTARGASPEQPRASIDAAARPARWQWLPITPCSNSRAEAPLRPARAKTVRAGSHHITATVAPWIQAEQVLIDVQIACR